MIDLKHVVLKLTLFVYLCISVFVYLHLCACDSNAFYFTNIEPTLYVRVGEMAVSKQVAFSNTVCQTTAQSLSWHICLSMPLFCHLNNIFCRNSENYNALVSTPVRQCFFISLSLKHIWLAAAVSYYPVFKMPFRPHRAHCGQCPPSPPKKKKSVLCPTRCPLSSHWQRPLWLTDNMSEWWAPFL